MMRSEFCRKCGGKDWHEYTYFSKKNNKSYIGRHCNICRRKRNGQLTWEEYSATRFPETCLRGHNNWKFKSRYRKEEGARYCIDCKNIAQNLRYRRDDMKREQKLEGERISRRHLAMEVILAYGGICACCNESRFEFLTIDHINNDGAEHKRKENLKSSVTMYRWLKKNSYPGGFQVLCMNCQCSKQWYIFCPHQEANL